MGWLDPKEVSTKRFQRPVCLKNSRVLCPCVMSTPQGCPGVHCPVIALGHLGLVWARIPEPPETIGYLG